MRRRTVSGRAAGKGAAMGVLLLSVAWAGCDRGEPGRVPPPEGAADVVTASATSGPATVSYPATVVSTDEARLATRTSGTVRRVPVDVGSVVRSGDTLVVLDGADVEARIQSAAAAASRASRYFDRIASLEKDGAATGQELDDARAGMMMAEAGLREARAQRDYVVLRAPFAGVVAARDVDPGDLAVPGRPVLQLVRPGSLKVVADLPGEVRGDLSPGTAVTFFDPATGRSVGGHLTRISPALEPASRRVRAEARPDSGAGSGLPAPGSFVRLELVRPERGTLWVPADVIVRRGQLEGAFVVEQDTLRLRWLRTGEARDGAVEVLAGLVAGTPVVRHPAPALEDGQAVGHRSSEPWTP
ncbi:MAG: efflux RND transporter periplasmic adaptor subunit [Candidatus Palauibacterales bacterium]|nr:efflux RND transporter periplasmic adaptor subunit [Candidatus Palauibacterales bacterium]MDP2585215.1 efflux RND transporter periplasmic adaptor subunit [Candidatus Palauibacterales bacterium]